LRFCRSEGNDEISMLKSGDRAPDFGVGDVTLHRMLDEQKMVVFFLPKTFTAG
jgi:peroxiredoxin